MPYKPKKNPREPLISTGEASLETGVPQATIASWCRTGRLRCWVTSGGHYRLRMSDLMIFLKINYVLDEED
jgi:excisionase family DNA binding protein